METQHDSTQEYLLKRGKKNVSFIAIPFPFESHFFSLSLKREGKKSTVTGNVSSHKTPANQKFPWPIAPDV